MQASSDHAFAQTFGQNHSPCRSGPNLQPLQPEQRPSVRPTQLSEPSRASSENNSEHECAICMDSFANSCLVPCGHTDLCMQCAAHLKPGLCPICRTPVEDVIRTVPSK